MRPAFSTTGSAATFTLLLLFLLALPAVVGKNLLPPRDQIYSSLPWGTGAFPYLHDQIFEETNDIDIAFMGSSRIWWDIDTPYVQDELSRQLGHKAVVRSLCWTAPGFDPFYFIMQDLLKHRKVSVIVFSDLSPGAANKAHPRATAWFRLADNAGALDGLSVMAKISFYTSAILGMPRNALGLVRTNLPAIDSDEVSWIGFDHIKNPAHRLGSLALQKRLDQPFAAYMPHTSASAADVCVYSEATKDEFDFSTDSVPPMQKEFIRKIGALARENHVRLVYLHLPESTEMNSPTLVEKAFWPDLFGRDLTMTAIPATKLFAGMTPEDVQKLYYNYEHFNQNGMEYFTPIVTPELVRIYEQQTNH